MPALCGVGLEHGFCPKEMCLTPFTTITGLVMEEEARDGPAPGPGSPWVRLWEGSLQCAHHLSPSPAG